LRLANLQERQEEQRAILAPAASLVKPGGRLAYVTCSVLAEENNDQVAWFLANHAGFTALPWRDSWKAHIGDASAFSSADGREEALLLTPARHGTDGFFIAVLARSGGL
jgi:16S rRNA (cytosine967-C5)-methyltransferase